MICQRRQAGFSLIELIVVVAIIGVFAGLGTLALDSWFSNQRTKTAARAVANILMRARVEAIRTRTNHVVFFDRDASGNAIQDDEGNDVAVLLISDLDGDGVPDAGEYVASVPFANTNSLAWGSSHAGLEAPPVAAPEDNSAASFPETGNFTCCTFVEPDGDPAHWTAFFPDGIPRSFSVGPFTADIMGSGNGAIYVTNGERDYAVVLAALGGVRLHSWNLGAVAWTK